MLNTNWGHSKNCKEEHALLIAKDLKGGLIMKLSIIIPVYNEAQKIRQCLERIDAVSLKQFNVEKEIVIVDDGSRDGTAEILKTLQSDKYVIIHNPKNLGKGAAIARGLQSAKGDIILIQDADLEYDPENYELLLKPIMRGVADVVYGSRFIGNGPHRIFFFIHRLANGFITFLCDVFTGLNLSDIETGYKVFTKAAINSIQLTERDFRFEVEVTMKLARKRYRFYEVGISYYGRTYAEGKKINWIDGVRALCCILKYGLRVS